ncbi:MAG: ribosomal protein L11 methyltransferase [Desulforhopalus sp.]|jgi:ribosomal protein L11 methyltransferase
MAQTTQLLRPDTQLFIYYIDGIIPPHYKADNDHFIGNWVEDDFSFLFFTQPAKEDVLTLLTSFPDFSLIDDYEMSYGEWQGGNVEPIRIGRFILNPTWIKASPDENDISITLDSGVVFGNGGHPTTQACLEAMEIACSGGKTKTMLDLGSGTGVLALAGAKLGCEKVLAVDYNFLATRTAQTNVTLNGLDGQIFVINGRAEEHIATASDLMVANIHYDVMKELVKEKGFYDQKWFILSGLLTSEAEKILSYLDTKPVLILKQWGQGEIWHTILGITQNN